MVLQQKLEEFVSEARIYIQESNEARKKWNDALVNEESDEEIGLSQFYFARVNQDAMTTFSKISALVYFANITNTELNLNILSEVNGLLDFVTKHKLYETEFVISPEGKLNETNPATTKEKYDFFKKQIKLTEQMIDESRN